MKKVVKETMVSYNSTSIDSFMSDYDYRSTSQNQNLIKFIEEPETIDRIESNLLLLSKEIKNGETFIDVGCSAGYVYDFLSTRKSIIYTGMDLSQEMIDIARRTHPTVKFIHADATKPIDGKYDVVFSSRVLIHLPNIEANIANLYAACNRILFLVIKIGDNEVCYKYQEEYDDGSYSFCYLRHITEAHLQEIADSLGAVLNIHRTRKYSSVILEKK